MLIPNTQLKKHIAKVFGLRFRLPKQFASRTELWSKLPMALQADLPEVPTLICVQLLHLSPKWHSHPPWWSPRSTVWIAVLSRCSSIGNEIIGKPRFVRDVSSLGYHIHDPLTYYPIHAQLMYNSKLCTNLFSLVSPFHCQCRGP